MPAPVKLSSPKIRVQFPDAEPMVVQTTNADLVLWDRTRSRHKWPTFEDAPFLWLTFISWAGARRTGAIALDLTYEAWERDVLSVEPEDDDADPEAGTPTPPGPEPG